MLLQGDVSNLADLDRLYTTVKQQKGHIDILFANAGTGQFAPLGAITEEHFDYSASKAAVRSLARTFTTDLKGRGIRVNAISPGVIPSPGYRNSLGMTEEQVKQYADSVVGNIPRNPGRNCQSGVDSCFRRK